MGPCVRRDDATYFIPREHTALQPLGHVLVPPDERALLFQALLQLFYRNVARNCIARQRQRRRQELVRVDRAPLAPLPPLRPAAGRLVRRTHPAALRPTRRGELAPTPPPLAPPPRGAGRRVLAQKKLPAATKEPWTELPLAT